MYVESFTVCLSLLVVLKALMFIILASSKSISAVHVWFWQIKEFLTSLCVLSFKAHLILSAW